LLIILNHGTLLQVFLAFIFSEFIRTLIDYLFSKRIVHLSTNIDIDMCKYLAKEALPFIAANVFFIIYYRVDILMLSYLQGNTPVGLYSAAYKLIDPLLFLPGALASTLMPVMSKQYITDTNNLKRTYMLGYRYIFMIMLPVTVGIYIISENVIDLLYTTEYSGSIVAMQILVATIIFNSLNSIHSSVLTATNLQKLNLLAVTICCIANVFLNIILIPTYSYMGAAFATLICVILLFFIGFYFVYRNLSICPINKEMIKPVIASCVMGLLMLEISDMNIFLLIVIGIIIYAVTIYLLRGFSKNDIVVIRKILTKH